MAKTLFAADTGWKIVEAFHAVPASFPERVRASMSAAAQFLLDENRCRQ
ncbi:MAG TPA: hypothetical protein VGO51_03220 [Burkholderiaceae bacterium]|jgi:hypothetical protein|nr:hypothetical protein [Burkholderiaceae bacterium]